MVERVQIFNATYAMRWDRTCDPEEAYNSAGIATGTKAGLIREESGRNEGYGSPISAGLQVYGRWWSWMSPRKADCAEVG